MCKFCEMASIGREVQHTPDIDQEKADAFVEKMIGVLNGGALTLMLSVGHRTGLFDTMCAVSYKLIQAARDAVRYLYSAA